MAHTAGPSLTAHFSSLPDPRVARTQRHCLESIWVIAICAIICGADDWVAVSRFGRAKEAWFRTFLDLPHGIPSHDTFWRFFAALDADAFSQCFASWIRSTAELTQGEVVAIDGKTLRRSFDHGSSKSAIHMVSAWASKNAVVLGQVKTEEKSNEITAIPKLLKILELKGCIVTIDAMGCQKAIAAAIVDAGADYVLSLKGNQGRLSAEVQAYFQKSIADGSASGFDYHEEFDKAGHGRREARRVWCTDSVADLSERTKWKGLNSIALVASERRIQDQIEVDYRCYISSLPGKNATQMAHAVRAHWNIENNLHWVLDVAFREDDCRLSKDNGPENMATMRHVALNLLKQERSAKIGIKNKRLAAGWDKRYLLKIIGI